MAPVMDRYDILQSYDWNFANPPACPEPAKVRPCPGEWDFCGLPVASPLGMPAGPLLNSAWIRYYASLGFSVLTYKTVRSAYRACYPLPNLLPIASGPLPRGGQSVVAAPAAADFDSWAISFGMPSKSPDDWREDVALARSALAPDQVLVVSVVASPLPDWDISAIADDFSRLSRWAVDSGAQAVEANLSCPNVCTAEGQLYQSPGASSLICGRIREAIGKTPLILKIGLFEQREHAAAFIEAVEPYANALSSVNSMSAYVVDSGGERLFGGVMRGIGGACIRDRCNAETATLAGLIQQRGSRLRLIGVGGIRSAADVRDRLAAGAHHVQIATAAMLDPMIAIRIREELSSVDQLRK